MKIQSKSLPAARRLLKLADDDRALARSEMSKLSEEEQVAAEDAQQHALSIEGLCQAQGGEASGSGASATEAELRQQVADLATAMRQVRTEL